MKKLPLQISATFSVGIGLASLTCFEPLADAQTPAPVPPAATQPVVVETGPDQAKQTTDFVRYVEAAEGSKEGDRLETVVRAYRREDQQVDLVSVIHIADPDYYVAMNKVLAGYEAVLYEMVGGPVTERDLNAEEADPSMAGIKVIHGLLQNLLALEYQTKGIDYSPKHFVHADVDWDEYSALMASRNQSMATLFQRAMAISMSGEKVPGLPTNDADSAAMLGGLLRAVTSGDANGLKRMVAPMLGEAETLVSLIEGDDGTVIITERNKVVMEEVKAQLNHGRKSVGVFYGAGHMPDLEARLLADGFKATEVHWMTAWKIGGSAAGGVTNKAVGGDGAAVAPQSEEDAAVNALGFFGRILQDEELMRSVVSGVKAFAESGPKPEKE
jgi:hypothetical protein